MNDNDRHNYVSGLIQEFKTAMTLHVYESMKNGNVNIEAARPFADRVIAECAWSAAMTYLAGLETANERRNPANR